MHAIIHADLATPAGCKLVRSIIDPMSRVWVLKVSANCRTINRLDSVAKHMTLCGYPILIDETQGDDVIIVSTTGEHQ